MILKTIKIGCRRDRDEVSDSVSLFSAVVPVCGDSSLNSLGFFSLSPVTLHHIVLRIISSFFVSYWSLTFIISPDMNLPQEAGRLVLSELPYSGLPQGVYLECKQCVCVLLPTRVETVLFSST